MNDIVFDAAGTGKGKLKDDTLRRSRGSRPPFGVPVKTIIHKKRQVEQVAFRIQTMHLVYKNGIWRTKLAFRLQICSFQFTNKHLALQTGTSDYNSAYEERACM